MTTSFDRTAFFITELLKRKPTLIRLMGDGWPEFEEQLLAILQAVTAASPETVSQLLEELLTLAEHTPAQPVFQQVKAAQEAAEKAGTLRGEKQEPGVLSPSESMSAQQSFQKEMAQQLSAWRNVVNLGFATRETPAAPLPRPLPLQQAQPYYFWLEIGGLLPESIADTIEELQTDGLPAEAELQVVLFTFEEGVVVDEGTASIGRLQLNQQGGATVVEQPSGRPDSLQDDELWANRLFFPVNTRPQIASQQLRCNIYYKQILLQSWLVTAVCTADLPIPLPDGQKALTATADYILSRSLKAEQLAQLPPHQLNIMLNSNGDGTHGFRLFGEDGAERFASNVTLNAMNLQNLLDNSRGALRKAAWGDDQKWDGDIHRYRYDGRQNWEQLRKDLVRMARWGYRFYRSLFIDLTGGDRGKQRQLETVLKPSSYIHFASKEAANMIMPLAMLYDRRKFNSDLRQDVYKLCPEFIQTVNEQRPLATSKCFQGACPSEAAADTVCPSGFWGFRHRLGMPVSTPTVTDIPTTLTYMNDPQLVMSVALNLGEVNQHMRSMIRLWPSKSLKIVKSPEDTILSFLNEKPHLVYFYCHGGETQGHAYLQVGTADSSQNISSETLFREDVYWEEPRPLVIINGCHTTALEPRAALDLVSGFMEVGNASGVIGTEITIFETLAQGFAEPLLSALLNGEPVGEAVRLARLALLQQKNPLGLVYVPFALAGVRMQRAEIVIN